MGGDAKARNIVEIVLRQANIETSDDAVFERCVRSTRDILEKETNDISFVLENKPSIYRLAWNMKMVIGRDNSRGRAIHLAFYLVYFAIFLRTLAYLIMYIVHLIVG